MRDASGMVTWYLAVLDEDERGALAASQAGVDARWHRTGETYTRIRDANGSGIVTDETTAEATIQHIARHDPKTVIDDIAAKRGIVQAYLRSRDLFSGNSVAGVAGQAVLRSLEHTVALLAAAVDHRPGFKEEWRP